MVNTGRIRQAALSYVIPAIIKQVMDGPGGEDGNSRERNNAATAAITGV